MTENLKGYFATSLAGHDKGRIFYIADEDDDFVYICDGEGRVLANPKKKRKKHLRLIKQREDLTTDREVRLAIKERLKDVQG